LLDALVISFIMGLKYEIRQPFFLEILVIVCWAIWVIRNDFIFNGADPSVYRARGTFKKEMALLIHKAST
jgi:hypothetical protein